MAYYGSGNQSMPIRIECHEATLPIKMRGGIPLETKHNHREGGMGRMPEMAPLANPYVPFQLENPPKYEANKGIVRGTLFPGLDLPFMGMVNCNPLPVTPKTQLQALGFAIQELALYLDTHPEDTEEPIRR